MNRHVAALQVLDKVAEGLGAAIEVYGYLTVDYLVLLNVQHGSAVGDAIEANADGHTLDIGCSQTGIARIYILKQITIERYGQREGETLQLYGIEQRVKLLDAYLGIGIKRHRLSV